MHTYPNIHIHTHVHTFTHTTASPQGPGQRKIKSTSTTSLTGMTIGGSGNGGDSLHRSNTSLAPGGGGLFSFSPAASERPSRASSMSSLGTHFPDEDDISYFSAGVCMVGWSLFVLVFLVESPTGSWILSVTRCVSAWRGSFCTGHGSRELSVVMPGTLGGVPVRNPRVLG